MSLRLILSFIVFVLLTIYFTYLNPGDIEITLAQEIPPVQIPIAVFLLIAMLIGVVLTSLFTGFGRIKSAFTQLISSWAAEKRKRRQKRWKKMGQQAESALTGSHRKKGRILLEKILDENPRHVPSLLQLGDLHRKMGQPEKAVGLHQKALSEDSENPRVLHSLAEDFAELKQWDKEIEILKKARQVEPDSLFCLRKLREAYRKKNDWDKVRQIQNSIISHVTDPQDLAQEKLHSSRLAYHRGCRLIELNQIEPAIAELRRAMKESNESAPPYIKLGDLYQKNDNLKSAIKIWKTGYEKTGSLVCLQRLREAYLQTGKQDEAIKLYREAVRASANSEKEMLSMVLAELYMNKGQTEDAIHTLWEISQPSLPAHLLLAQAHQKKKELDKADQVIRAAVNKVATSLSRFVCRECKTEFEQWSGACPQCQGWDTLQTTLNRPL
ncbi:MAG: tetratricopeptide repeat protein [Nitrospinaceae bacterium]|nr:tetratricopeptide repeat protein [Nitrospinaceae bacterium]NIR55705.1 tetratricopeptide repeat protein [Nitrospinaceae bacterium]NIS86149.1 tetratricopeptide repeat protein [Nitrospinaceae bacterium]NIT82993.1 tetratricopeptide repeat protein [Nitrospinaceae bacterium]NIU45197.1 tetratricopeptide repeat protein [Nitrospinaceae bacterium]